MKISKKYLNKVIKEELNKFLIEMQNEREMLDMYVELHDSLVNKEKYIGKKIKPVTDKLTFEELLSDIKSEKGMSAYDLYDELRSFQDKIDSDMYEKLRDAFQDKIYEEDSEYIKGPQQSDDEFDAEMSDLYMKTHGKPDLRIVK